jgi:hypothetical protein
MEFLGPRVYTTSFIDSIIACARAEDADARMLAGVNDVIKAARFTYTELMGIPEPARTKGMQCLDGVVVKGTIPLYRQAPEIDWDGKPFLMVHVDPEGTFKVRLKDEQVRIPGTNMFRTEERYETHRSFAAIPDPPHSRMARQLIFEKGWPARTVASQGNTEGTVAEFRWLKLEASLGDLASPGVIKLYREVLSRDGLIDLALSLGELTEAEAAEARALIAAPPIVASPKASPKSATAAGRA